MLFEMDPRDLARDDELAEADATEAWIDRLADHAPPPAAPLLVLDRLAADLAATRGIPEVGSW